MNNDPLDAARDAYEATNERIAASSDRAMTERITRTYYCEQDEDPDTFQKRVKTETAKLTNNDPWPNSEEVWNYSLEGNKPIVSATITVLVPSPLPQP